MKLYSIKKVKLFVNTLYKIENCLIALLIIALGLTLLDETGLVEMKSVWVKLFVSYGLLGLPVVLLLYKVAFIWVKPYRWWPLILAIVLFAFLLIGAYFPILFLRHSVWKTQTLIHQHTTFSFYRTEFQMKDLGALGYNSRTVKVLYITPWFMITDDDIDVNDHWKRLDKDVNELGLKGG